MSTTVKYTNSRDGIITEQQLSNVKDYDKKTYEDGSLKRVDTYYNGELHSGIYYLSPNENKQMVVSELSSIWGDVEVYFNTQSFENFSSKDWEVYSESSLVLMGKIIVDAQDRMIARQILDVNSLNVVSVEKIFYLTSFDGFNNDDDLPRFGQFDFYYFPGSGEVELELNLSGFELDRYVINNTRNILNDPMIKPLFKWEDHPYYHSASPLIPNTPIV
jgi:hypothetical protein